MIKLRYLLSIPVVIILILYFIVDNKCLNPIKTIKSYNDLGFNNLKTCYLKSLKSIIKQKTPKLFSILSDVNRAYFGKYDKDILNLELTKSYEDLEKNLYEDVFENLKENKLSGIINSNYQTPKILKKNQQKFYKDIVRQNKDNENSKYYEINLNKITTSNKPTLAWSHKTMEPGDNINKWKRLTETSPVFFKGKIIYLTPDLRIITLNAATGNVIWEKELLHFPSIRGFLVEEDLNGNENLYLPVDSNIYKINARNGKLIKNFGNNGSVNSKTIFSPFIYKDLLIVVSSNIVLAYNKQSGKKIFHVKIFNKKNYAGAMPWGGAALDENRGIVYLTTGNPRPKVYGVKRPGINDRSNSIIAIDIERKKVLWDFKETFHDLWNLDVAFPPVLTNININNKNYDVVIVLTKTGNFLMLERLTGKPIFDIGLVKAPKSKIPSEITSPFQLSVKKPEPITKFDWSLDDISKLNDIQKNFIINKINDYEFGLFKPPALNLSYIYLAEGPIWEGAALNKKNNQLVVTVNHTPTITRPYLKSLWPHSKVSKKFSEEYNLYKKNCSSCHGINRNGVYKVGKEDPKTKSIFTKYVPSLVGHHLFDYSKQKVLSYSNFKNKHSQSKISEEDYNKINKLFLEWDKDLYSKKRINVSEASASFVDQDKNYLSNYPHGEIVNYDIKTGKKIWQKPFGYENNMNVGTFNKGGLMLSSDGTIFATGTTDKKIFAFNSENGNELWSYQMELAGSAPPIIFEYDGIKYLSVIAVGGYNFKFPDRGSILYTFKLN